MKRLKPLYLRISPQAYRVVDELKFQYGYCYIARIVANLHIPRASVRRAVQELRRVGFDITLEDGFLELHRGA